MATEAQIAANRKNAQASTGPKTAEGKARSLDTKTDRPGLIPTVPIQREAPMVGNAVSLGLFTKENCVQPQEQDEYNNIYNAMWRDLSPVGAMEEMFATEIVRGAWRLRRCATAEADLSQIVDKEARRRHENKQVYVPTEPYSRAWDPIIYSHSASTQVAIDRARTQAVGIVRRATADLRRLQNERLFRAATFPEDADASQFGIASFEEVLPKLPGAANAQLLAVITPVVAAEGHANASRVVEITNRTESAAAPSPEKQKFRHYRRAEPTEIHKSAA